MTKIEQFKEFWRRNYDFVPLNVLTDKQIMEFIQRAKNVELAAATAFDYVLAQGLADGLIEE